MNLTIPFKTVSVQHKLSEDMGKQELNAIKLLKMKIQGAKTGTFQSEGHILANCTSKYYNPMKNTLPFRELGTSD